MAATNVSVNTKSVNAAGNSVAETSSMEHDEIVYGCKPDPEPEKDCCCKTYHIVLNFN